MGEADDPTGVAEEVFQEGEFPRLELDLLAAAHHLAREEIHDQIAESQPGWFRGVGGPADQSLDARQQLGEGERLGQIIVPARLQSTHPVVHRGLGAEDDDRQRDLFLAQRLHQGQAVELGEHDVDDGRIVRDRPGHEQAFLAIRAVVYRKAALLETIDQEGGDLLVIFHHEDSHNVF